MYTFCDTEFRNESPLRPTQHSLNFLAVSRYRHCFFVKTCIYFAFLQIFLPPPFPPSLSPLSFTSILNFFHSLASSPVALLNDFPPFEIRLCDYCCWHVCLPMSTNWTCLSFLPERKRINRQKLRLVANFIKCIYYCMLFYLFIYFVLLMFVGWFTWANYIKFK